MGALGLGVGLRPAGVVVQGHRGLGLGLEVQLIDVFHQIFGDVIKIEALLAHVHDVVVEVDAGRTPHHHPLRLELLEVGGGGGGHRTGRIFVAPLIVLDAAAIGLAADGREGDAHQLEDVGDGADQVGGAEHVATQVENDVRLLHVVLWRRQEPVAVLGFGLQPMDHVDLPEILLVKSPVFSFLSHLPLPFACHIPGLAYEH